MKAVRNAVLLAVVAATALTARAGVMGACRVQANKPTEILCTINKEGRGIIVDVRPDRPKVKARIATYWKNCGWPRWKDIDETYIFSQQDGRTAWYRYNLGFKPIEGWRNLGADCIEVYLIDCREVTAQGDGPRVPCTDVLTANGFTIR